MPPSTVSITYESDAVRGVLGLDPEARLGRPFEEHVHHDMGWVRSMLSSLPAEGGPPAVHPAPDAGTAEQKALDMTQDRSP